MKKTTLLLAVILLSGALFFHDALAQFWWSVFAPLMTKVYNTVFKSIFGGAITTVVESDGVLKVIHPKITILVGKYCAGMDGLLLFSILFFLVYATRHAALSVRQWLSFFWGGISFMLGVNLLRVLALFTIGIWLRELLGFNAGSVVLRGVAHVHFGWVFYALGLAVYFPAAFRLLTMIKTREHTSADGFKFSQWIFSRN